MVRVLPLKALGVSGLEELEGVGDGDAEEEFPGDVCERRARLSGMVVRAVGVDLRRGIAEGDGIQMIKLHEGVYE